MKKKYFVFAVLIVFSIIATMKMMILGMNIDEEYAIAMAYRMASGDRMFLEMWEPHQMSGFVCAFFIKLFMMVTQSKTYLVLYLRGIGVLIQLLLSVFTFNTFKKTYSRDLSFWAALVVFNALPKWSLVPDFSNLFLWFNLGTILCLYRFTIERTRKELWMVSGALFYCGAVLCYPSALLMLPMYFAGLWRLTEKEQRKKIWIFPGSCMVMGIGYVLYFLGHMNVNQFLYGISQMMTDREHTYTIYDRLMSYGTEMLGFLPPLAILLIPSLIVGKIWGKKGFCCTFVLLSALEQLVYWLWDNPFFNTPLLFFYTIYAIGFLFPKKDKALFQIGFLPSGVAVFAVLLLTNTMIGVSGIQLLPGIICSGLCLGAMVEDKDRMAQKALTGVALLSVLILFLFAKGWFVVENGGYKADILFVKQKALYGPAKSIYCDYMNGYEYNQLSEALEGVIDSEDSILYVGRHSLRYLLFDANISMYSTISTPTFDERLLEYWKQFPDRYPTVVIVETIQRDFEEIKDYFQFQDKMLELEGMKVYFTEKYKSL